MLPAIRLATPDEIKEIAPVSDITPNTAIWAFPNTDSTKKPDFAVVRQCYEIDPMLFAEGTGTQRKLLFAWGAFNILRSMGVPEIYFNIGTSMEDYIAIIEKMGAERTTQEPQFRFKKAI